MYVLAAVAVAIGTLLVVFGIRRLRRWMTELDKGSSLMVRMSCAEPFRKFAIPADGAYDIWIEGPRMRVNPLIDMEPQVRGAGGGSPLPLRRSIFRTNMTRGSTNVMKIADFSTRRGDHVLGLVPQTVGRGRLDIGFGRALAKRIPWPRARPDECFLQIRTHDPVSADWVFQGVLPIVLGGNLLIGGVIAGLLGLAGSWG